MTESHAAHGVPSAGGEPDAGDPAEAAQRAGATFTSTASRHHSRVWGAESEAVAVATTWARERFSSGSDPKTSARSAVELDEAVGPTITPTGLGHAEAMRLYDEVLIPATRSADDPMNLAYIPGAPTRAAVAFDTVVSAANVFGGVWEGGAGAIYAENQVLRWLMGLLGWPADAAGTFVAGGTAGNLSALATARQRARDRWGGTGTFQSGRPSTGYKLACAQTAHSSIRSAAALLDVGVVLVPVDERGHLTGPALARALDENPGVFAVVASAGTTNAGIVDDLADVVDVAHARGVWVHVDGAYGGAALLAPSVRERFAGIDRADSFIVDPHKWLFAPYDCCALVYRDPAPAYRTHSQHAEYLDSIERTDANPSDLAAHLSRRTRGLPLWYSLVTHGTDRYVAAVEQCLTTTRQVADAIRAADHLELVLEPELSVVVFRRPGWTDADYAAWSDRLAKDGVMLCVPTKHDGETVLRLVFVNPETRAERVIEVLEQTMR